MRKTWDIKSVTEMIERFNKRLGLEVSSDNIRVVEKSKTPFCRHNNGEICFVEAFFNHYNLTDNDRCVILAGVYSRMYLRRNNKCCGTKVFEVLTKGICDLMKYEYVSRHELEKKYREIRRELYKEPEYFSFFSVGEPARAGGIGNRKVTDISKDENGEVIITVEPTKSYAETYNSKTVFTEDELYEDIFSISDMASQVNKDTRVDLRQNLYVLSAPSGTGKNTVYNLLKEKLPYVQRVVTVTTRPQRPGEYDGIDYFFITKDEFIEKSKNGEFVETNDYDGEFYATPFSEIVKYPKDTPLFLIIDVNGAARVQETYPLAHSIFLTAPSTEELINRLSMRGTNTPESIKVRLERAEFEMKIGERKYEYIIVNDHPNRCCNEIIDILKMNQHLNIQ